MNESISDIVCLQELQWHPCQRDNVLPSKTPMEGFSYIGSPLQLPELLLSEPTLFFLSLLCYPPLTLPRYGSEESEVHYPNPSDKEIHMCN